MRKKRLLSVLVAAALGCSLFSAVPIVSQAAEYTSGDWTYTMDGGCTITKYNGSDTNVVVPSELDGRTVIAIAGGHWQTITRPVGAFADNTEITSVTIPDTVQTIGMGTFVGCTNLINVDLGNSVRNLGTYCFGDCDSLTSVELPASMTSSSATAEYPFQYCDSLKTVTIASGGVKIPDKLFYGCSALENVNIPEGITTIGGNFFYGAFRNCISLKKITIPNSVQVIEVEAFYGCTGLTDVELGNSVRYLGNSCFGDCDSLNSIELPASMTTSNAEAEYPFSGCDLLKNVTIASGGVKIPNKIFSDCGALENVNIPEGIVTIGGNYYYGAFRNCVSLKKIVLPASLKVIREDAFYNCSSLAEISLPEGVESVCAGAFDGCSSLKDFYDYSEETEYGSYIFGDTSFLTMHGFSGSNAEAYAKKNSITFVPLTDKQMYRLYNKHSGEHFYTNDYSEKSNLVSLGWAYEGTAWIAPTLSNTPVYRVYNPNSGEHHYTMNASERDTLVRVGWRDEGIGWYSDENQRTPMYRLYNPNATGQYEAGGHHYTKDVNEKNSLIKAGWRDEGIGWYGK